MKNFGGTSLDKDTHHNKLTGFRKTDIANQLYQMLKQRTQKEFLNAE